MIAKVRRRATACVMSSANLWNPMWWRAS